jgi:hypothetical protein
MVRKADDRSARLAERGVGSRLATFSICMLRIAQLKAVTG